MWPRTTPIRSQSSIRQPTRSRPGSTRARLPGCFLRVHRRCDVCRDALSGRRHAVRGQQRRQLHRGDSPERPEGRHGQRSDSDRLRAARPDIQRRRLADLHRERQEWNRPEPRTPGRQHRQHHEHRLPWRQYGGGGRRESGEPIPVPAGTGVPGEYSGAGLERTERPDGQSRQEQFLPMLRPTPKTRK